MMRLICHVSVDGRLTLELSYVGYEDVEWFQLTYDTIHGGPCEHKDFWISQVAGNILTISVPVRFLKTAVFPMSS
jgi:hypothetical protein